MEYTVIRSKRKTISLELRPDGLLVHAPRFATKWQIDRFVKDHELWIEKHRQKLEERQRTLKDVDRLSDEDLKELVKKAKEVIPKRVAHYAPLVGVTYGRITIRNQKTRWGSCSAKGI